MGDAAGVGPEVIVRAWGDARVHEASRLVVLGHPEVMLAAVRLVGSPLRVETSADLASIATDPDVIGCLPVGSDDVLEVTPGKLDRRTGQAAYEAVVRAARGTLAGEFQGLVTAPLSKAALHAAGHHYPGHTELLAELCGVDDFAMMLYLPPEEVPHCPAGLGVAHVTLHMALRDVFANLTPAAILTKCQLASTVMHDGFGLDAPRVGVCALNPHAGEEGLFGDEEARIIRPAVELACARGIDARGPFAADSLFHRAIVGEFDAVLGMYHDQALGPLKVHAFGRAVNVTLGLPLIRTSVDHGTAFDIAGQGRADSGSMLEAVQLAIELAGRRAEGGNQA